ncbi:MAG: phosphate-starvation-inducible PsiE family protein [Candidatus Velthaea sp.]
MNQGRESSLQRAGVRFLRLVERLIFFIIGAMLFAAAFALLWRAIIVLGELFASPGAHAMDAGAAFLDVVLLVLMVVELAYTVILSLGGIVLSAEPFLIVGLIAVIRRILVITVGEVQSDKASSQLTQNSAIELAILTGVVLAFVASIVMLRRWRSHADEPDPIHTD